jgi:serine/threonine protein kinase
MIGQFRSLELLGSGAMGTVHVAMDTSLEREVAIKSMHPELSQDKGFVGRFRAEATSLARLNHPNITTLYSLLQDGDNLHMVTEVVRGRPLDIILKERGAPLGVDESLAIVSQVSDGLSYAHQMGVIHRDIKPSNLMIANDGRVKIMDFGIARIRGSVRMTRVGEAVGTPLYMSPEQCRGGEGDERSDLYSLAIVLYEMLSGSPPFTSPVEYEILQAQINSQPAPLVPLVGGVSAKLEAAIMTALAKRPEQRFPSIRAFSDAIGATALRVDAQSIIQNAEHLIQATKSAEATSASTSAVVINIATSRLGAVGRWYRGLHPAIQGVSIGAVAALLALIFNGEIRNFFDPNPSEKIVAQHHEPRPIAQPIAPSRDLSTQRVAPTPGNDRDLKESNCNETFGANGPCVESKIPDTNKQRTMKLPAETDRGGAPTQEEFQREKQLGNYSAAFEIALTLVKRGDSPEMQTELGLMYWKGQGTQKDVQKAKELFVSAAKQNYPRAQVSLGSMYQDGVLDNGAPNLRQAVPYFKMAADNGNAKAQFWLGCYYEFGWGRLKKDPAKAKELFMRASAQRTSLDVAKYAIDADNALEFLHSAAGKSPCQ